MQKLEGVMGTRYRDKIGDFFNDIDNQNDKLLMLYDRINNLEIRVKELEQVVSNKTP